MGAHIHEWALHHWNSFIDGFVCIRKLPGVALWYLPRVMDLPGTSNWGFFRLCTLILEDFLRICVLVFPHRRYYSYHLLHVTSDYQHNALHLSLIGVCQCIHTQLCIGKICKALFSHLSTFTLAYSQVKPLCEEKRMIGMYCTALSLKFPSASLAQWRPPLRTSLESLNSSR